MVSVPSASFEKTNHNTIKTIRIACGAGPSCVFGIVWVTRGKPLEFPHGCGAFPTKGLTNNTRHRNHTEVTCFWASGVLGVLGVHRLMQISKRSFVPKMCCALKHRRTPTPDSFPMVLKPLTFLVFKKHKPQTPEDVLWFWSGKGAWSMWSTTAPKL